MKRIMIVVAMIALLSAGLGVTAAAAPLDDNCNHYSGGGSGALVLPDGAAGVRMGGTPTGTSLGSVQLCRRGDVYWAYIIFYDRMPTGKSGNAILEVLRGGAGNPPSFWSCDSPLYSFQPPNGANHHVYAGQTRCWTPKITIDAERGDMVRAVGYRYTTPNPSDSWDARGKGAWK